MQYLGGMIFYDTRHHRLGDLAAKPWNRKTDEKGVC
jgi:hypothetical protein